MDFLILAAGLTVVLLGAEGLVRGGGRLALRFRVPAAIVGLTLVAWGTSAPELVVSLAAALDGASDMALGNVVGSCIANIGLVLGLSALLRPLPPDPGVARRDFLAALVVLVLLPLMLLDELLGFGASALGRVDGIVLVSIGVGYHLLLVRDARRHRAGTAPLSADQLPRQPWPLYLGVAIVGIVALAFGSSWFVEGAVGVARRFDVSDRIIGLTILAIGTSLPELATSVVASLKGQHEVSLGNVVGSNIFNIVFALGVTAIVAPVPVSLDLSSGGLVDMLVAIVFSLLLAPALWSGRGVSRGHGALLAGAYGGYLVYLVV